VLELEWTIEMDKELVDDVARLLHRQYSKEILGTLHKWEKLESAERSSWRLIARSAVTLIEDRASGAKRPAAPKKPVS
jgi:hypothetical protein